MDLAAALADTAYLYVEDACGQPQRLSDAVAAEIGRRHADGCPPLRILAGVVVAEPPWAPAAAGGGAVIRAVMAGRGLLRGGAAVSAVPIGFSDVGGSFRSGRFDVDAVAISVTASGTLGIQHSYVPDAIESVRVRGGMVLVERNAAMVDVAGAPSVDLDGAVVVDSDLAPVQALVRAPTDAEETAAANAAALVPDHGCVQMGIGTIGDAFCRALATTSTRGVSMHTGMLGDGVMDLAASPVLGRATPLGDPPLSAACLIGSDRLFGWAAQEPRVRLHGTSHIHAIRTTSCIERFCAVNFALEVDLDGNVGAESVAGRVISGPGGQLDFATGASAAPSGRSIIVLTSTGPGGASRIVGSLSGPTTTPASRVQYVVTEHGVADLGGASTDERAEALIAVAAPEHRNALRAEI